MINFLRIPILLQYTVVITANLSVLIAGMGTVWSSPVLARVMNQNQTILSRPVTDEEAAWMASLPYLTGLIMNFFAGYLLDSLGRKTCVILSCVPRILTGLVYVFAKEIWVILLVRALSGPVDILCYVAVPTYASEMASKENRGKLGAILQVMASVGILIILGIGPFVSYVTLNIILVCLSAASSIPLLFLPDSPYFLFSKGKVDDAQKLLIKLRGSDTLANEELKEYILAAEEQNAGKLTIRELLKNKLFLKAVLIVFITMFCGQICGYVAVITYLQPILELTHTSVSSQVSSLVVGCIQVLASFSVSFFTDKFGRKPILIGATTGVAVGVICLGAFFKVQESQNDVTGFMNYLPLVGIILVVYCNSAGFSSIIWVIVSEIFDGRTRAVGASTSLFMGYLSSFLVIRTLPLLLNSIGPAYTYWISAVVCFILCLFVYFFVPEMKGKSFAEIQDLLGKKSGGREAPKII